MNTAVPSGSLYPLVSYLVIIDLESTCDDGCDPNRQEIVEWPWVVYDTSSRCVVDYKQIFIAPAWNSNPNPLPAAIGNVDEDVLFAASLKEAVHHFDTYLLHSFVRHRKSFCLLTDGPWDVQHLLLLEAARKAIPLAPHYRCFFNLRAEFSLRYPQFGPPRDRYGMLNSLGIARNTLSSNIINDNSSPSTNGNGAAGNGNGINLNVNLSSNNMCNTGIDDCIAISDIVTRMIYDGHVFRSPFVIPEYDWSTALTRIPSVAVPVAAAVPIGGIVRLRGLPWSCSEMDIARFLQPISIVPAGIHFVRNSHGKSTGEAFVQLENEASIKAALAKHHQSMGRRYIEVFKSSPNDMTNHLGRADARRLMHQQHQAHAHVHKAAAAAAVSYTNNNSNSSRQQHGNRDRNGGRTSNNKGSNRNHNNINLDTKADSIFLQSSSASSTPTKQPNNINNNITASPHYPPLGSVKPNSTNNYYKRNTNAAHTTSTASGLAYVVRVSGLPDAIREDDLLPLFDGIEMAGGQCIRLVPLGTQKEETVQVVSSSDSSSSSTSSDDANNGNKRILVRGNNNNNNNRSKRRGRREAFVMVTSESWVRKACLRTGSTEVPAGSGNIMAITVARSTAAEMDETLHKANGSSSSNNNNSNNKRVEEGNGASNSSNNNISYLMQVRNLEGATTIESVAKLFSGMGVTPGDVMISGENYARVAFLSAEARDLALEAHNNNNDIKWEAAGTEQVILNNNYSTNNNSNNNNCGRGRVVRMRGLPYTATSDDIVAFFRMGGIEVPTKKKHNNNNSESISRGKDRHGRASGEAWVTLATAKDAQLAVLKLDKKHMGSRYIELLVCGQR